MQLTYKNTFLVGAMLLITGCGGGESESGKTVRLNGLEEIALGESTKISTNTQYTIKAIKPIDGNKRLTLDFEGKTLSAAASTLQSPAMGTYDVYMVAGKNTFIQRYEVLGINTSALAQEKRAYSIKENYDALLDLKEDKAVYQYLVDLAYLREVITPAERDIRINEFDATASGNYDTTKNDFDTLLTVFDRYLNGEENENTLSGYVDQAEASLQAHGVYGLSRLHAVEDIATDVMFPLPEIETVFVEDSLKFSRFFDSSLLEKDPQTGEIRYTSGYEILTPLTGI